MMPPPVRPGARVGVAALSGPPDPEALEQGLESLEDLGFRPVPAANLDRESGIFAGSDEERLAAFHELVRDPDLPAILFARGGSGVMRILPEIDWELLRRTPRAYVGYSDLTPFLCQVVDRLDLVAFHGPMVATDLARGLTEEEERSLLEVLGDDGPPAFEAPHCLRPGRARGRLIGGCASLLSALQGTAFAPNTEDAILLLEDVEEPPYRVDRMLTHLRLSGSLAAIRGVVIGQLGPEWDQGRPSPWQLEPLEGEFPIASGLSVGHEAPNLTLPLGLEATLDSEGGAIRFEETTP